MPRLSRRSSACAWIVAAGALWLYMRGRLSQPAPVPPASRREQRLCLDRCCGSALTVLADPSRAGWDVQAQPHPVRGNGKGDGVVGVSVTQLCFTAHAASSCLCCMPARCMTRRATTLCTRSCAFSKGGRRAGGACASGRHAKRAPWRAACDPQQHNAARLVPPPPVRSIALTGMRRAMPLALRCSLRQGDWRICREHGCALLLSRLQQKVGGMRQKRQACEWRCERGDTHAAAAQNVATAGPCQG